MISGNGSEVRRCDGGGGVMVMAARFVLALGVSVILGQLRGRRPHDRASLREQNLSANMLHGRQAAANPKFTRPSRTQCRHRKVNMYMHEHVNVWNIHLHVSQNNGAAHSTSPIK